MDEPLSQTWHSSGHSTNLVGRPSAFMASPAFNDAPVGLHIWGVREMNPALFTMLDQAETLPEAGEAFLAYMVAMFGIDPEQREAAPGSRKRYRSSFLRLIQGWTFDSNGPEGAVLKGWVESRFGILPSFHKEIIPDIHGPIWQAYVEERMQSRFHDNAILVQLDMLFEFCQWAIGRFAFPGQSHITLYRGINAVDRHGILDQPSKREAVIRLNNLVSFSSDREVADCFGDRIITTRVPLAKVLFFPGLLPSHLLRGEREFLVLGGAFRVSIDDV
ncbi:NAD+--dinitrogen-reductase ADP-D-ribosyltransferase [Rhodobacter viridis]|uniref:NAD+--dinitrogen-reductase ADP-D-ribosyltransferase n=1 Tax=Rhodobacter viridis TaxID=1054202 RepID=A0A318U2V7_9RHOB|nr:NAD(+)--dinitrogen-reductase ADP-D-ribosyltransferase [Rhodobacter viridis]PYF09693.1 NAD+--dinitrogen-reductase ADP-D-ribosyltransferase [Rhodobacter viridis]